MLRLQMEHRDHSHDRKRKENQKEQHPPERSASDARRSLFCHALPDHFGA
jgi:hypothetical protein